MWWRQRRDDRRFECASPIGRRGEARLGGWDFPAGWRIFVIESPIFNIESHGQWDFFMHRILILRDPLVSIVANRLSRVTTSCKILPPFHRSENLLQYLFPGFLGSDVCGDGLLSYA